MEDAELVELFHLLSEFQKAASDYKDEPLSYCLKLDMQRFSNVLEARKLLDETYQQKTSSCWPLEPYSETVEKFRANEQALAPKTEARKALEEAIAITLSCLVPLKASDDIVGQANNVAVNSVVTCLRRLLKETK